jgi:hypothetical protein
LGSYTWCVPCGGAVEVGIEARSDGADERPPAVGDAERFAIALDQLVLVGGEQRLRFVEDLLRRAAVAQPQLARREGEIAH